MRESIVTPSLGARAVAPLKTQEHQPNLNGVKAVSVNHFAQVVQRA